MALSTLPAVSLRYNRSVFLTSGSLTLPGSSIGKFDALLVAGGGGGGKSGAAINQWNQGGGGCFNYYSDVTCTPGTTLTVTVGAGGAGATATSSDGGTGTASSISGIVGNGATSTISSGTGYGGRWNAISRYATAMATTSDFGYKLASAMTSSTTETSYRPAVFGNAYSYSTGNYSRYNTTGTQIGQGNMYGYFGAAQAIMFSGQGGTTVPLAGSLLHATQGSSGANVGANLGGASQANTFFAGGGGGSNTYNLTGYDGQGGGGGGGGGSNTATNSGDGGNASANSGAGGGGAGKNSNTAAAVGNGGNGGSGFVVIGYWG